MFNILYHNDLDFLSVEKTFSKTLKQLQTGDFKSADVRKMTGTNFYRARLDIRDRLLFNFVTYRQNKYLLLLEINKDHNYARSRFMRGGAVVDENKLTLVESPDKEMETAAIELPYVHPEVRTIHTLNKFISFDKFQQSVYTLHPPLIIVGSAGSGKTALVLDEPYRVFEEFKGVVTGSPVHSAWLSFEEYLALGVKQSIFSVSERERLYPIFTQYVEWMAEENLYDGNILCYEYLQKVKPCYEDLLKMKP